MYMGAPERQFVPMEKRVSKLPSTASAVEAAVAERSKRFSAGAPTPTTLWSENNSNAQSMTLGTAQIRMSMDA